MINVSRLWIFLALVTTISGFTVDAVLADVRSERIDSFRDWTAYTFMENGSKVCYIASKPVKEEGDYKRRGDVFAFVTHRPAANEKNTVSFLAGYTYQTDSTISVTISGQDYTLFSQDDRAWAPDTSLDERLIKAMKAGARMVVKGTSKRGTLTTDTYSLMGFTKAIGAINRVCGVS